MFLPVVFQVLKTYGGDNQHRRYEKQPVKSGQTYVSQQRQMLETESVGGDICAEGGNQSQDGGADKYPKQCVAVSAQSHHDGRQRKKPEVNASHGRVGAC